MQQIQQHRGTVCMVKAILIVQRSRYDASKQARTAVYGLLDAALAAVGRSEVMQGWGGARSPS